MSDLLEQPVHVIDSLYQAAIDYGSESGNIKNKNKKTQLDPEPADLLSDAIESGDLQKIDTVIPEIEAEIKRYIDVHEALGLKMNEKMRKEVRDKFYTRSSNPDDCTVIGSGMPLRDLKRMTPVIQDKESFERNKDSVSF